MDKHQTRVSLTVRLPGLIGLGRAPLMVCLAASAILVQRGFQGRCIQQDSRPLAITPAKVPGQGSAPFKYANAGCSANMCSQM
eukprot:6469837-Amphidinium_carterae.2